MKNNTKMKINWQGQKLSNSLSGKVLNDFCESTSLHGYSYLINTNSFGLKLVWFLVILTMTGLGIAFLSINTNQYFKARLVTNIESSGANLSVSIAFHYEFLK